MNPEAFFHRVCIAAVEMLITPCFFIRDRSLVSVSSQKTTPVRFSLYPDTTIMTGNYNIIHFSRYTVPISISLSFGKSGYYTDYGQKCQVFHLCRLNGTRTTMSCPPAMVFDENEAKCVYGNMCVPPLPPNELVKYAQS